MWLLNTRTHRLEDFEGDSIPSYAILSHRWEDDEVLFADMIERRHEAREGWAKINACWQRALGAGLDYVWADTCCIDKKSSAELSEAINSMFRWYRKAFVCYAYLCDVTDPSLFTESVWFTRGWTLQELLAPKDLFFFDKDWNLIGSKDDHSRLRKLSETTRIPRNYLRYLDPVSKHGNASIAQKMSWAAYRQTTRVEDRAYSLMGMFDVNMPLLYGEANKAFLRLQEEVMKHSRDVSILAWPSQGNSFGIFAASPDNFADCKRYDAVFRRYSATKHEVVVDTRLYLQSSGLYAMPVAHIWRHSGDRDSVFILLKKTSDHPANELYHRLIWRANIVLKDAPGIKESSEEKRIEISRDARFESKYLLPERRELGKEENKLRKNASIHLSQPENSSSQSKSTN